LVSFKKRYGWKVFLQDDDTGELLFEYQSYKKSRKVPRRQWLKTYTRKTELVYNYNIDKWTRYPLRFHIYLERPSPVDGIVKKVRWKGLVAVGYQYGLRVVVANQLKVN
jgi:hypothetical protein